MKYLVYLLMLIPLFTEAQKTSYYCGSVSETLTMSCTVCPPGTIVYEWTSPSSVVTSGATVSATVPGVWSWSISGAGCNPLTGTHTLVVEPEPEVDILADDICINTIQSISASGVPGGYTYSWSFGAGASPSTSTLASEDVEWSTTGTKTITLQISKTLPSVGMGECTDACVWNFSIDIQISEISGTSSCGG
jgi:hypothetical protein